MLQVTLSRPVRLFGSHSLPGEHQVLYQPTPQATVPVGTTLRLAGPVKASYDHRDQYAYCFSDEDGHLRFVLAYELSGQIPVSA